MFNLIKIDLRNLEFVYIEWFIKIVLCQKSDSEYIKLFLFLII